MFPDLPLTIEPKRLARKGETINGQYALLDMHRLCKLLHDPSGHALFRLVFIHDEDQGRFFIEGRIQAILKVMCQRCMQDMELRIDTRVRLAVVNDQAEAARLPESCEPLFTGQEPVSLPGLIEDELILALPISTVHENECRPEEFTGANNSTGNNPFVVLRKLKQK